MARQCAVSVVLSTFNRAGLLGPAIDALLHQRSAPEYEVIIVDNNSTDDTASVVQARLREGGGGSRLRYVFEPRQGLSHARNAGIATARSELVAFTDDDVRVRPMGRILGLPRFAFGELLSEGLDWIGHASRGREAEAFWHEGQVRELVAYMWQSRDHHHRQRKGWRREGFDGADGPPDAPPEPRVDGATQAAVAN